MNMNVFKKISNAFYLPFVLGYDILQTQLNHYDIPCDVAFEYCLDLYETYSGSIESQQDKSDYECIQDYVNNHMHEIESEIIELAKKYSDYELIKEDFIMIKDAKFVSVWDGYYEVITSCKVDMETKEVFDIEMVKVDESLEHLDNEYIIIDGEKFDVFSVDEVEDQNFWYE